MNHRIDLNADVGEGFGQWRLGDDDALLGIVTSANVACGFHAGDSSTMRRTCETAVANGVRIGAQVAYRDLAGFGRRVIEYAPDELTDDLLYQLGALDAFARTAGDRVRYVKPHGALYNRIVHDDLQAGAVVEAVRRFDPALPVLGLPRSAVLRLARDAGLPVFTEAFADRAYTPEATLVPRSRPGAVVTDDDAVCARSVRIALEGTAVAVDGTEVAVDARSLCVHGDTPGSARLAARVRAALTGAGVAVEPFT